jgi:predicted porin
MQKKLIALAVAGLVSAPAFAQSNVTIYGIVDMGLSYLDDNRVNGVGSRTAIESGQQSGSRLGFRGVEDLGNGLKAGFVLEQGFFADTGAARNDGAFSRQSFLYLQGGFGTVALGRQYSPQFNLVAALDPFGLGTVGEANNVYGVVARMSNAAAYVSPSFSGFNVTAAYSTEASSYSTSGLVAGTANSAGIEDIENNNTDVRAWAISPVYNNGPLMVGLNYHELETAQAGSNPKTKAWDLGGSYDFGVVKLAALYGNNDVDNGAETDKWMVGLSAPVGAAGKVLASYVNAEVDRPGSANDGEGRQWALGYEHNLSKRTNLYAAYADIKNDNANTAFDLGDASGNAAGMGYESGLNVGVRHKF